MDFRDRPTCSSSASSMARRLMSQRIVLLVLGCTYVAASRDSAWCKDKDAAACSSWAAAGECNKNPGFMRGYCMRSCDKCDMLDPSEQKLGDERVQITTPYGDILLGFFPEVAPVTVRHIVRLFQLGCYHTNHFFRVDKGFVAQIQSVVGGQRVVPASCERDEANKNVPLEASKVRHVRGVLSMGRMDDPNSGGSSFSLLLGDAPHLDGQYTVFGMVLKGDEALTKMEQVETKKEGIFVMPQDRIEISDVKILHSTDDITI